MTAWAAREGRRGCSLWKWGGAGRGSEQGHPPLEAWPGGRRGTDIGSMNEGAVLTALEGP